VHPAKILIIYGHHPELLQGALEHISSFGHQTEVVVLVPLDDPSWHPGLAQDIFLRYKQACYQQGQYQSLRQCPLKNITCHSQESLQHLQTLSDHQVLLIPESLTPVGPELLDITLSAPQETILTSLETLKMFPDETLLQAARQACGKACLPLADTPAQLRNCIKFWLETPPAHCEKHWFGQAGEQYRHLADLSTWRYNLLKEDRNNLERAIFKLFKDPCHWGAHLVLLLYQRIYDSGAYVMAPAWFRTLFEYYTGIHQGYLKILPPPDSYTVTVIILTYNRIDLLKRALESVMTQTYCDWKILIGDGGSTDETEAYCTELARNHAQITYLRKEAPGSKGIYDNAIMLYNQVDTEWVVCCCDDDFLQPLHLEKTVGFLKQHPWLALVSGSCYISDRANTQIIAQSGPYYPQATIADTQLELQRFALSFPTGVGIMRTQCLKAIAEFDTITLWQAYGYDEAYQGEPRYAVGDSEQTLGLTCFYEVGYVPEVIACLRTQALPDNNTSDGATAAMQNVSDTVHLHMHLFQQVFDRYCELFGEHSYPYVLAEHFLEVQRRHAITEFEKMLRGLNTVEDFRTRIKTSRQRGWEFLVARSDQILSRCSPTAPILVPGLTSQA
jgi:glycosyltransferase domain-containing protein